MSKRIPDRLLRFALHTTTDVDEKQLRQSVQIALGEIALKHLPDLLRVDKSFWDYHAKIGRRPDSFNYKKKAVDPQPEPYIVDDATLKKRHKLVKKGKSPELPIKLDPFMADRHKRSPKLAPGLGRHQFFILTIPYYEGTFRRKQCKPNGSLFDIGYQLKKKCGLASAVPDLQYPHYQMYSDLLGNYRGCPENTDSRWHIDNIGYNAVPSNIKGECIRIGHPDTGWTRHSQLNFDPNGFSLNYDLDAACNILNPSASAEEAVPSAALSPHHGTATGGLLISNPDNIVNGIAPGATVIPIRAIDSVVLIGDIDVALGIVAAVDAEAHVISMSLGGYPAPILEWAVNWTVANNVIVVAAAGNQWPFVVYPAAYPACIAVSGSTIEDTVWEGSARDYFRQGLIDISAPSECVTIPYWDDDKKASSRPGRGTSLGTAIVAGTAALWLQRFDRNALIGALSGRSTLQELFRAHLKHTARKPSGWDTELDGPGILNLNGLMDEQTLPNPRSFPFLPIMEDIGNLLGIDVSGQPGNRFTPPPWIEAIFGENAEDIVDQIGEELVTMLMSDPVLASLALAMGRGALTLRAAAEDAGNKVEEFIDTVTDTASDVASQVAGWFGF